MEDAPDTSPEEDRQFRQAGPLAERVGQRHWALEQSVSAMARLEH